MADTFASGAEAYIKLGAQPYDLANWRIEMDPGVMKFFKFGSKYQWTLPSGASCKISARGPYNLGLSQPVPGSLYVIHLGWMAGVEIVVTGRLGPLDLNTVIQQGGEPASIELTFDSHGPFTLF